MNERWERVARILKEERVPNAEIARRLNVAPQFVARVRRDLGIAAYRYRPPVETQEDFDRMTVALRGGHRRWRGLHGKHGTPMVNRTRTAYQLAFRLARKREPVGRITPACSVNHCVEGLHLLDRLMREQAAVPTELPPGATWQGLDLIAVRRALYRPAPYPPLSQEEQKLAAWCADPAMPHKELARRLGCCDRSARQWRGPGATPC